MKDTSLSPPLEIERKYLIPYPDTAMLEKLPGCVRLDISQTYLKDGAGRARKSVSPEGCVYTHTVKRRISELVREETEREISQEEYLALLRDADPNYLTITKTRFRIPYRGHIFEIDIFPFWQDKAVAEVELSHEDEEIAFPQWLNIINEVTFDPGYKNTELARIK